MLPALPDGIAALPDDASLDELRVAHWGEAIPVRRFVAITTNHMLDHSGEINGQLQPHPRRDRLDRLSSSNRRPRPGLGSRFSELYANTSISSCGTVASSWSNVHASGGLSVRQRLNVAAWRKRGPCR